MNGAANGCSEPKADVFGMLSLLRLMAVKEGLAQFQNRLQHTVFANPVTGSSFGQKGKLEPVLEKKNFGEFINKHLYLGGF